MSRRDADWDIETTADDPTFTHVVSFSDVVAHEREDLVARAESFLAGLDGIERALHEDREVIGLVAPDVATAEIVKAFRRWWQDASQEAPPWEELLKRHSSAARDVLKPLGYKKLRHTFNRQAAEDVWHVIELRRIEGDEGRIEIGIYIDGINGLLGTAEARPAWIREHACHIRAPVGERHGFSLRDDPGAVADLIATEIVPGLRQLEARRQLRAASDDGKRRLGMNRPANPVIAALAALDGDRAVAGTVLQQSFDEANRQARAVILAIGERMGLDPIATGADPTLSVQDEVILAAWQADQQRRLTELQALLDAHPVSGRLTRFGRSEPVDISAGRKALPGLWRWLVQRTKRADGIIATPQPLPQRYGGYAFLDLSDAQRTLAELLATYMFEVVSAEVPGVEWDFDVSGALAVRGRRTEPIINRGQQIVSFLLERPAPAAKRQNQLADRIDWLTRELG